MAVMGTYRDRPREAGSVALRSSLSNASQGSVNSASAL